MLIINPATLRHLHETVHRLARGLWFAYSGELVQDGTTIDSDNPDAWLEDAARLLLGGQLDHVTNLDGAEALHALRTIDDCPGGTKVRVPRADGGRSVRTSGISARTTTSPH